MTEQLTCRISGNIALELDGYQKLMTLLDTYGTDRIANLLEKAGSMLAESQAIILESHPDVEENEMHSCVFADEGNNISALNELEEGMQLRDLSQAFKELKLTSLTILEIEE